MSLIWRCPECDLLNTRVPSCINCNTPQPKKEKAMERAGYAREVEIEMPRYKSHKVVHALKIKEIRNTTPSGLQCMGPGPRWLVPENGRYAPIEVDLEYQRKHSPQPGGYYVVYEDGYKSYSPAAAFESGYTLIED